MSTLAMAAGIIVAVAESIPTFAVRVTRPFQSEQDLLEDELETFTRTSITLLGAQPRPPGLVLRFELSLASGQVLVRGEGRVVGYKPDAHFGTGGLTLRFTRLDSRSKAFIDRAASMRERRRPSAAIVSSESPSSPSLSVHPEDIIEDVAPSSPSFDSPRLASEPAESSDLPAYSRAAPAALDGSARVIPPPPHRDALLERLRARSQALNPEVVRRILERRT